MTRLARSAALLLLAVGLFAMVLAGMALFDAMRVGQLQEQAEAEAREFADQAARSISHIREVLAGQALQELADRALAREGGELTGVMEHLRSAGVDSVNRVRVFGQSPEDLALDEPLGFLVLDLLLEARRAGSAMPELRPGDANDQPELLFARRIERAGHDPGLLLLEIPAADVVDDWSQPELLDVASLGQRRGDRWVGIWTHGERGLGQSQRLTVRGSRLEFAWQPAGNAPLLQTRDAMLAGAAGAVLFFGGLLMLRVGRSAPAPTKRARPAAATGAADRSPQMREEPGRGAATPGRAAAPPPPPPTSRPEPKTEPDPEPQAADPATVESMPAHPAPAAAADSNSPAPGDDLHIDLDEDLFAAPEAGAGSNGYQEDDPDSLVLDLATDEAPPGASDPAAPDQSADAETAEPPAQEAASSASNPDPLPAETGGLTLALDAETDPLPDQAPVGSEKAAAEPAPELSDDALAGSVQFRRDGVFGRFDAGLDAAYATWLGEAVGSLAVEHGVQRMTVARDGRLHGPVLLEGVIQSLRGRGIDLVQLGAVPAPVMRFAAQELADRSGVMVSGSQRSAEWNGIQVLLDGVTLEGHRIQQQLQALPDNDGPGPGELTEASVIERYIERVAAEIQLERPLKVVADCANGVCGLVVPRLFKALGADVIPLYADVDGQFPNHPPDPTRAAHLEDLRLCVRSFGADLGLAFDGDGQRLNLVSGSGDLLWPDSVLMLLARDLLARQPASTVVCDALCSTRLVDWVQRLGGVVVKTAAGPNAVAMAMTETGALLGGSFSGHLFIEQDKMPVADSLFTAGRLLEILAADTRPVSEILADLPERFTQPECRLQAAGMTAQQALELLRRQPFDELVVDDDGAVLESADAWAGLALDADGLCVRVRVEGRDEHAAQRMRDRLEELLGRTDPRLTLSD